MVSSPFWYEKINSREQQLPAIPILKILTWNPLMDYSIISKNDRLEKCTTLFLYTCTSSSDREFESELSNSNLSPLEKNSNQEIHTFKNPSISSSCFCNMLLQSQILSFEQSVLQSDECVTLGTALYGLEVSLSSTNWVHSAKS